MTTARLTVAQSTALASVARVLDSTFYLAGGVAVAVHLDHRVSHDLDLFSPTAQPELMADAFAQSGAGVRVLDRSSGTLHLEVDGVPVSALRYSYPSLSTPAFAADIPVRVASLDDLIAMKLSAIAGRGAARDFWDLHVMLDATRRSLAEALALFQAKYAREDIGHVVRSLAYFTDAEAAPLPTGMTPELWSRIRQDFEARVRVLSQ